MPKITIFYHIFMAGPTWLDVVKEQLSKLKESGLYDVVNSIQIHSLGHEDSIWWIPGEYSKCLLASNSTKNTFELNTIRYLHSYCRENPGELVLYMHTKGVTRTNMRAVNDWRLLMEYYCINKWKDCVELLTKYNRSAVGVNIHSKPVPHFSGNIWWATSDHVSSLHYLESTDRMEAEFYILSRNHSKACSLFESGIDHYHTYFPKQDYENRSLIDTINEANVKMLADFNSSNLTPPEAVAYMPIS